MVMHTCRILQPDQTRSPPDPMIWEVADSEDEAPSESPKQSIATLVEGEHEPDRDADVARFFPKGRGLFKKPEKQQHPADQLATSERPLAKLKLKQRGIANRCPSIVAKEVNKRPEPNPAPPSRALVLRRSARQSKKTTYAAFTEMPTTTEKPTSADADAEANGTRPTPPAQINSKQITRRSSSPHTKIHRSGREIQPWTADELDHRMIHTYELTLTGIEAILKQYSTRGEILSHLPALQWPISRKPDRQQIVRYCLCGSEKISRSAKSNTQRCHDPACAVPGGWYHLACLSEEELRDILTVAGKWVCRGCIKRRELEGFPELYTESLRQDRYALMVRKVLAWKDNVNKEQCRVEGGMAARERRNAELIDMRLWGRGMWPMPGDAVLAMYTRWTAVS